MVEGSCYSVRNLPCSCRARTRNGTDFVQSLQLLEGYLKLQCASKQIGLYQC